MAAPLLYLYGFVRAGFDMPALTGVEEASPVFLIEQNTIACAASMVAAGDYDRRVDSRPDDLEWLQPRAWRHHEVLHQLHLRGGVVPLKFGTLCADAAAARAMLDRLGETIVGLLSRVEDKDEWTLRIGVDDAIVAMADCDTAALPPGRAYLARKQLRKAAADRVAACVDDIEAAVCGRLAALGAEFAHRPRLRRGDDAATSVTESAVLVRRDEFADLESCLRELEDAHGPRVRFELVGPWPPYSFASISQLMPAVYDSQRPL
jgi:hypothetical protein